MDNATRDPDYKLLYESVVARRLWKFFPPFILFIGNISSVLAIFVLNRKKLKNSTTMLYLKVLSFADMLVLNTDLLSYWLRFGFDLDLTATSSAGCKIVEFLVYFSTDFCNWILVAVTVDRCISICLPFRAKRLCTRDSAKFTCFTIGCVMFLINSHLFWGFTLVTSLDKASCLEASNFVRKTWPWIDFCIYSFFPFLIMLICNGFIVRNIVSSRKRVADIRTKQQSSICSEDHAHSMTSGDQSGNRKSNTKRISRVTIMLQSVDASFFILTMPVAVWNLYLPFFPKTASAHQKASMDLAKTISYLLEFTNNAIHFFLYCLTGSTFRKELFTMFKERSNVVEDHRQT